MLLRAMVRAAWLLCSRGPPVMTRSMSKLECSPVLAALLEPHLVHTVLHFRAREPYTPGRCLRQACCGVLGSFNNLLACPRTRTGGSHCIACPRQQPRSHIPSTNKTQRAQVEARLPWPTVLPLPLGRLKGDGAWLSLTIR